MISLKSHLPGYNDRYTKQICHTFQKTKCNTSMAKQTHITFTSLAEVTTGDGIYVKHHKEF